MKNKSIIYFAFFLGIGIITSCSSSKIIGSILISEFSVDDSGNSKDSSRTESFIKYNNKGQEILYKTLNHKNGDIRFDIIKDSHYNTEGKLKLIHEYYKYSHQPLRKDFKDSIEFKYNKNGLLKERIAYKPSGWDIDQKWTLYYDSKERVIKKSLWSRYLSKATENPIAEYITYQYLNDTIIKKRFVNDKLCSTSTHYKIKNDSITINTYDFNCIPKNKTIIKKCIAKDSKIKYIEYKESNTSLFEKFDPYGNLLSRCGSLDSDKCESHNEYIYDSYGNWTTKTTFFRNKKSSVTIRKIEY